VIAGIAVDLNRRRIVVKRRSCYKNCVYSAIKLLYCNSFRMLAPYPFPVEGYKSKLMEISGKPAGIITVWEWTVEVVD